VSDRETGAEEKMEGEAIDAQAIAERIKERVRHKMASGFYDEKEVEKMAEINLKIFEPAAPPFKISLYHDVAERESLRAALDSGWNLNGRIVPEGGAKGKALTLYKKVYRKLLRPIAKLLLWPQTQFNSNIFLYAWRLQDAIDRAEHELTYQRRRYMELSQRMQNLEKTSDETDKRVLALEGLSADVKKLASSLEDVDRQGIFLKNRVSAALEKLSAGTAGNAKDIREEREKLESFDYTLFENVHRGSREEIRRRLQVYANWFKGAQNVLDVGCGRGELLEILRENAVSAYGIDINDEMVAECRERGLSVHAADAIGHLKSLKDSSLGGLAAVQVIEHLPVDVMTEFFRLAFDKLAPGAVIAAETINPTCLTTFCGAFYLDMSHTKPVHPLAVQFLLERTGFKDVRVEYLNPYPEKMRLKKIPLGAAPAGMDTAFIAEYNANVDKLNGILYSHTDYAVVAKR